MATEAQGLTTRNPTHHIGLTGRSSGLGSILGKTVRDARVSVVAISALLSAIVLVGGATMASTYGTPETRLELASLSGTMPPILRGLYGNPVNVDTLGGFVSWHYGAYFALLVGLWSLLALSGTLAGEARRGSLEFAVVTPNSRRRIALEKIAGHVAALAIVMAIVALVTWLTGALFEKLPGDAISPDAAVGFAIGLGFKGLIAGSIAFAVAALVGRGAAAGLAGAVMVAGYVVNSYRAFVPAFETASGATWFSWSAGHIPLAGETDWAAVAAMGAASAGLLALGVEAFVRRDVGATVSVPTPRLPAWLVGVRGPVSRSFGDQLPAALAWGIGLGLYGIVMAASARSVTEALADSGLADTVRGMIPGVDITTAEGFLQLAFAEMGFVLVGLAAAALVAGRSSDETSGRLELQLTTPLTRVRWAIGSAVAVLLAIGVITAMLGGSIAAGVALGGDDPTTPAAGTVVLAVYAAALAGIGVAVAGLFRASLAMPVVLAVSIGTFLIDLLAPALHLPDWVEKLALTAHLGQPMVGAWDLVGTAGCVAIAIGGLALGAVGMARRDVGT
jgi:polyether ionophore transport system permease protein